MRTFIVIVTFLFTIFTQEAVIENFGSGCRIQRFTPKRTHPLELDWALVVGKPPLFWLAPIEVIMKHPIHHHLFEECRTPCFQISTQDQPESSSAW